MVGAGSPSTSNHGSAPNPQPIRQAGPPSRARIDPISDTPGGTEIDPSLTSARGATEHAAGRQTGEESLRTDSTIWRANNRPGSARNARRPSASPTDRI